MKHERKLSARQTFKSAKSLFSIILMLVVSIGLFAVLMIPETQPVPVIIKVLLISVIACFIWILTGTGYVIGEKTLKWFSGPFRGEIPINSIRKIRYDNGFIKYQTWKPALHHHGIIVYYNKFDDIFISPKDCESFIEALRVLNPNIDVENL